MATILLIVCALLIVAAFYYTIHIGYKDEVITSKQPEENKEVIPPAPVLTQQLAEPEKEKKPRKPRVKKTS